MDITSGPDTSDGNITNQRCLTAPRRSSARKPQNTHSNACARGGMKGKLTRRPSLISKKFVNGWAWKHQKATHKNKGGRAADTCHSLRNKHSSHKYKQRFLSSYIHAVQRLFIATSIPDSGALAGYARAVFT